MENKNFISVILAIGLILVSIFAVYSLTQKTNLQKNTISVSGSSTMDVVPDQAVLYLRMESINNDPKIAQEDIASVSNGVIDALKKSGLSDKEIETINYNLEKLREWENTKMVDKGYRASHSLKLTIKDLSKVGSLINLAVDSGANNVESLQFILSKEKEREVKSSLLSAAASDARSKADLLAESLDSRVKGVVSVSEAAGFVPPVYYAEAAALKSARDEAPVIQPKSVSTTVNVNAVFEIA
ncbi:MAG TPA: SIMPL domain-containing protein [Candidatus Nanoarchaeia archaeon]|nr:SIMPL domain-containing protein [Candidatus Nanoarchaeia archaeon]